MPSDGKPTRIPIIAVILAFGAAIIGFIAWQLLKPVSDSRVETLKRRGYPVTLGELNDWYQSPPSNENAAFIYTNIFARSAFSNAALDFSMRKWPARGKKFEPADLDEIKPLLAANEQTFRLFQTAGALPKARYPIDLRDGSMTMLPHLAQVKSGVGFLSGAAVVWAQAGKDEEAVAALIAAGKVADSLQEEPTLISQLVRYAAWAIVCSRIERVLNLKQLNEEQLARLQQSLASADNPGCLARGLGGETASGHAFFTVLKEQRSLLSGGYLNNAAGTTQSKSADNLKYGLMTGILKVTGIYAKDRAFYLDSMATNLTIAEQPYPERFKGYQKSAGIVAPGRFMIFSRMLLPALAKAGLRDADHTARVRVAQTALAVERFRRANSNSPPAELNQLTPAFLSAVPLDPFNGQPLLFKRAGEGYVVYSVGSDGHDNGGLEQDPNNRNAIHDVTCVMER